jgi:2-C-methyl-D-erythritol 4-phosphate cytidylyltransferase
MPDYAIVVAGGSGERFHGKMPKQFAEFRGRPLLWYVLQTMEKAPGIDGVILVMHSGHIARARELVRAGRFSKIMTIVPGGTSRQLSVWTGLQQLTALRPGFVLIHDAARPFFSTALVAAVLDELQRFPAVVPVLSSRDSLLRSGTSGSISYLDRDRVRLVQTPQGFMFSEIFRAHEEAMQRKFHAAPDDLSLLNRFLDRKPSFIDGEILNCKITFPRDLEQIEALLRSLE